MMGMHLLQGLDFGVAQGGDILHRVCSLRIGWTKAHWDTSRGNTQSSGAILSKSNWILYQNLCPGTYLSFAQINDNILRPEQGEQARGQSFGEWVRWVEHDL